MSNEYKCLMCMETFTYIENDNWNDNMAVEEYKKEFPDDVLEDMRIVCEVCYEFAMSKRVTK